MPKTLDITRILREQKELLRAGFQDCRFAKGKWVMAASWFIGEADITLRVCYFIVIFRFLQQRPVWSRCFALAMPTNLSQTCAARLVGLTMLFYHRTVEKSRGRRNFCARQIFIGGIP